MKINNRSDFKLRVCLRDHDTQEIIPLPLSRFKIELYTREAVSFACRISVWSDDANVRRSDDNLLLDMAIHHDGGNYLPDGTLMCRFHFSEDDAQYKGGVRQIQCPVDTGVTIWEGDSDFSDPVDIAVVSNYYKGDPGPAGVQGERGETGAVGAVGPAGKSAYRSAVEGGYTGVEAAFAAELAQVGAKVDAIPGKGLSTNDYDDAAQAEVAKIAGKADAEKTYTTVVNTPEWTAQPTIGGALDGAFVAYPEDYYFVTLRTADGAALPAGQFRLTPALDAAYAADPAKAIDQTFTLAGLDTGNSGVLKESAPVDFTAVGAAWKMRSGGVSSVQIDIGEQYRQDYDFSCVSYVKTHRVGYAYFNPFAGINTPNSWMTLSGVGGGYGPGNGFLFYPYRADLRKHNISCETLNFRRIPDCWMAEYSRSIYAYNGTLSLRTELQNAVNKESVNGFCFSTVPNYSIENLNLGNTRFSTLGNVFLNGSSFRITLKKRP